MRSTHRQGNRRRLLLFATPVILALASVGGLLATRAPADAHTLSAPQATGITIMGGACAGGGTAFCFNPEVVHIAQGSQVTWTNASGVGHTASSCTPIGCSGAPANTGHNTFSVSIGAAAGSTGSFTFTSAGKYFYYCMIHGYTLMHGEIIVIASPTVRSFAPPSGSVGTTVTITGKHLAHASAVTFHGTHATIISDSSTSITTKVPSGATTGPISVTTKGGTVTTSTNFTVT
jgi:plastocyanin